MAYACLSDEAGDACFSDEAGDACFSDEAGDFTFNDKFLADCPATDSVVSLLMPPPPVALATPPHEFGAVEVGAMELGAMELGAMELGAMMELEFGAMMEFGAMDGAAAMFTQLQPPPQVPMDGNVAGPLPVASPPCSRGPRGPRGTIPASYSLNVLCQPRSELSKYKAAMKRQGVSDVAIKRLSADRRRHKSRSNSAAQRNRKALAEMPAILDEIRAALPSPELCGLVTKVERFMNLLHDQNVNLRRQVPTAALTPSCFDGDETDVVAPSL